MAPIVHGLESEYYEQINFVYLDISDPANNDFLRALGFRGTPHFFLVDGSGTILQQWVGSVTAEELREAFDRNL